MFIVSIPTTLFKELVREYKDINLLVVALGFGSLKLRSTAVFLRKGLSNSLLNYSMLFATRRRTRSLPFVHRLNVPTKRFE